MNTPYGLIAATLLFWGWQSGLWLPAVGMVVILEGSRLVKTRIEISTNDFRRVWSFCSLIILFAVAGMYTAGVEGRILFIMIEWLPVAFLPIITAQAYSKKGKINLSVFSVLYRESRQRRRIVGPAEINISFAYFGVCVISASAGNGDPIFFYTGLAPLAMWALYHIRPRRRHYRKGVWIAGVLTVLLVGYTAGVGLHQLQAIVEEVIVDWYADFLRSSTDPFKTHTAIGEIRDLKRSNKILFRVRNVAGPNSPILLMRSSFNIYKSSSWFGAHAPMKNEPKSLNGLTWVFDEKGKVERVVTVSTYLANGSGLLTLTDSTYKMELLPISKMSRNRLGTVKVEDGPGYVNYRIVMGPDSYIYGEPDHLDLEIPKGVEPAISKVAALLDIGSISHAEVLQKVQSFFANNFKYSLNLESGLFDTPISDFLFRTKAGHCEYFATTTALLLRKAGIPTRYAVGYAVNEFSWLENAYIVRARDAHSWVLVYVDGKWKNFDTTPGVWVEEDRQNASPFEALYDLWSYLALLIAKWRWSDTKTGDLIYFVIAITPLLIYLAWKIRSLVVESAPGKKESEAPEIKTRPGADSPFFQIEKRLKERGYSRNDGETHLGWIERLEKNAARAPKISASLEPMILLHYRLRFDPYGLSDEEKSAFNKDVMAWLEKEESAAGD